MKQSSVEWLFEQVVNLDWKNLLGEEKIKIFEQAKEMEKQQIESAYYTGAANFSEHSTKAVRWSKQYYNETFNK